MSFWIKTNRIVKLLFPRYVWDIPSREKTVYLTFDDGPIPDITTWVLLQLKNVEAKATFFCIGENVRKNPSEFAKLLESGHSIGNHTFNHINGWKTSKALYVENVLQCARLIDTVVNQDAKLFRPPYGKITPAQSRKLRQLGYKIIMWDIVSFDFDQTIGREKCLENVLENITPGSIIVFHDSVKAFKNLEYVLPKTLAYLKENGYKCAALN